MNKNNSNGRQRRTGLFGGTFNPIHIGHLKVAMDVLKHHRLDCIYFIPSAQPPHKKGDFLASARDRLQMVHLAVKGDDCLYACAVEIERGGRRTAGIRFLTSRPAGLKPGHSFS